MHFKDVIIKTSYYTSTYAITDGKYLVYQEQSKCHLISLKEANITPTDKPLSNKLKEELIYFYYSKMIKPTVDRELKTYRIEIDYWLSSIDQYDETEKPVIYNRINELRYLIYEG